MKITRYLDSEGNIYYAADSRRGVGRLLAAIRRYHREDRRGEAARPYHCGRGLVPRLELSTTRRGDERKDTGIFDTAGGIP